LFLKKKKKSPIHFFHKSDGSEMTKDQHFSGCRLKTHGIWMQ